MYVCTRKRLKVVVKGVLKYSLNLLKNVYLNLKLPGQNYFVLPSKRDT